MKCRSKRFASWGILLVIALLFGCNGKTAQNSGGLSDTTGPMKAENLQVVKNHKTDYVIVIPEHSKTYVRAMAERLARTVEAYTGAKLQVRNDSETSDMGGGERAEKEILLGITNRPEQTEKSDVDYAQGYSVSVVGDKLLFNSETQSGLYLAISQFVQDVFGAEPEGELPTTPVLAELLIPRNYLPVQRIQFSLFPFFDYPASDYCVVYDSVAQMQARYAYRISEIIKTRMEPIK